MLACLRDCLVMKVALHSKFIFEVILPMMILEGVVDYYVLALLLLGVIEILSF